MKYRTIVRLLYLRITETFTDFRLLWRQRRGPPLELELEISRQAGARAMAPRLYSSRQSRAQTLLNPPPPPVPRYRVRYASSSLCALAETQFSTPIKGEQQLLHVCSSSLVEAVAKVCV